MTVLQGLMGSPAGTGARAGLGAQALHGGEAAWKGQTRCSGLLFACLCLCLCPSVSTFVQGRYFGEET